MHVFISPCFGLLSDTMIMNTLRIVYGNFNLGSQKCFREVILQSHSWVPLNVHGAAFVITMWEDKYKNIHKAVDLNHTSKGQIKTA